MNINDAALRHLGSRSRTVQEMRGYLIKKGFEKKEIEELIGEFTDCGYLNDFKYCLEYFDYAYGKGKGKLLVMNELRQKGIAQGTADAASEEYTPQEDEAGRARREAYKVVAAAGIEDGQPINDKVLARAARKLKSKGYRSDTIYRIVGELRE